MYFYLPSILYLLNSQYFIQFLITSKHNKSYRTTMDLSKFKNSSKTKSTSQQKDAGFLKKNYTRAKYWLYPPTTDRRNERMTQYRTFAIFLGAVAAVVVFEDKIKTFLEI